MNIENKVILEYSEILTVLYVEDDEILRPKTAKLLESYFKKIDLAKDGKDGLEKYNTFKIKTGSYYDIVITDIEMPKMGGIDMSKIMIRENDQQSIIFTTGIDDINFLLEAISIGVSGFLRKPIDLNELKKIIYKTTKNISEHNFINSYYQNIEAINIQLIDNKQLKECNHLDMIVGDLALNKNHIMNNWINDDMVKNKLRKHIIDNDYFKTHFGEKVFDYFIGVAQGNNKAGNCPVIVTMLDFFKHKNLPLESIFIICVNFKNAITTYICQKYSFNSELYHELSLILDKNFEGVITQYMSLKLAKYEKKAEPIEVEKIPEQKSTFKKIDYTDYVFEHDIYEMKELEVEIDNLVISVTMKTGKSAEDFSQLGYKTKRYGRLLMSYPIFEKLGDYIAKLGDSFIENAQVLFDNAQKVENITILVEGFVNDLIIWRKEIFENNIADAEFLNDSFFSNVSTIIQYIEYDENADYIDDGDGMEFF
ncbi:MAG: response regulator [Sulfurimonas sp.]|jgi:YesN/AraC family two-component response regulator